MFATLSVLFIMMFVFEVILTGGIFMNQEELDRHMTPFIKWYCIAGMGLISVMNLLGLSRLWQTYRALGTVSVDNYIHAAFAMSIGLLFVGVLIYHYRYLRLGRKLGKKISDKLGLMGKE